MRSSPDDLGNILSSTPGLTADEGMRFEDEEEEEKDNLFDQKIGTKWSIS